MFKALKDWYLATFLPFEDPSHPLYHDQAAVEAAEAELQEIWDEIDAEDYEALLAPQFGPFEEVRPRFKGSMVLHTRRWYEEHDPSVDWDSLPKA